MIQYFLDYNTSAGYTEYLPPFMVNEASAFGTGQLPDKEGQMYYVKDDDFYLIPTAEVPVTNIYRDVILKEQDLPLRMTAYTPCFRREAGSYGKDVRGLNRLHQFDKVEIVQVVKPEISYDVPMRWWLMLKNSQRARIALSHSSGYAVAIRACFQHLRPILKCSAPPRKMAGSELVTNFKSFQANWLKLRSGTPREDTAGAYLNGSPSRLPHTGVC
jgi:seryl-tRNA synthetase